MLLAGHKVNQGTLEGGIARANPKLFRDEPRQRLIPERYEPGRAAVTANGNLRLEACAMRRQTDDELLLVIPQPDFVDRRALGAVGQLHREAVAELNG